MFKLFIFASLILYIYKKSVRLIAGNYPPYSLDLLLAIIATSVFGVVIMTIDFFTNII